MVPRSHPQRLGCYGVIVREDARHVRLEGEKLATMTPAELGRRDARQLWDGGARSECLPAMDPSNRGAYR